MKSIIKIYIHHSWSKSLFYKLFHNTENIVVDKKDDSATVTCNYKNLGLELIFDKQIHDNKDGYHLIDWFAVYDELHENNPDVLYNSLRQDHDYIINTEINKIVESRSNWIISILRTEKIYTFDHESPDEFNKRHQSLIDSFSKNHYLITDNFYLMDVVGKLKMYHVFTNSIFQWNSIIDIRWFYEFKNIFSNLNLHYDLGFSVRNTKSFRLDILKRLSKLNDDRMFLQISDFKVFQPTNFEFGEDDLSQVEEIYKIEKRNEVQKIFENHKNIKRNKIIGDTHFSDLSVLKNGWNKGLDYDLFFRYLSKSKVQILDESWGWYNGEFPIQYMSEKTIGYILSAVPFIPTHPYPLQYLSGELKVSDYPFINEVKSYKGNPALIVKFIETFMQNFDQNYKLIKDWVDEVHNKFMYRVNNENSFLELLTNKFDVEFSVKKNKSII